MDEPSKYMVIGGNAYFVPHMPGKPAWFQCGINTDGSPDWSSAGEVDTTRGDEHLVKALEDSMTPWLQTCARFETAVAKGNLEPLREAVDTACFSGLPLSTIVCSLSENLVEFQLGYYKCNVGLDMMEGKTTQFSAHYPENDPPEAYKKPHEYAFEYASSSVWEGDDSTWGDPAFREWLRQCAIKVLHDGPASLPVR